MLIRAHGEQFAINFEGDSRDPWPALLRRILAGNGERVDTTTSRVDRVHAAMVGGVTTDVQR
jgi:hypothetical protein